jgi:hypothetical protein
MRSRQQQQKSTPTPEKEAITMDPTEKCSYRSCKVTGAELLTCSAAGCSKKVHMICYHGYLLHKFKELQSLPYGMVSCTKKCHAKVVKEHSGGGDDADGGNRKGNWDCDGKKGPEDPHTSVKILLDWWMKEGNYNRYCGKNNSGMKKIQYCNQLADKMSRETNTQRNAKNVQSKIQHIEKTFKDAYTFASSETGAGLEEDDKGSFEDAVRKKCPYYFDLLDIMADRASSKPKATSYDDSDDSDSTIDLKALSELSEEEEEATEEIPEDAAEDAAEKSVATKSVATKRPSVTSSSKKAKKKKPISIMDDETIAALAEASKTSKHRMNEMVRHNQFIERLEERKLALEEQRERRAEVSWQGKADELQYKMQLLERYNQLKKKHQWTDEQIVTFYPDMSQIVKAQKSKESTDSE